jgi:hypothetical protein
MHSEDKLECSKCKEYKSPDMFGVDKKAVSRGCRNHWCKKCMHDRKELIKSGIIIPIRRVNRISDETLPCRVCGRTLPRDSFGPSWHHKNRGGKSSACKECQNKRARDYALKIDHCNSCGIKLPPGLRGCYCGKCYREQNLTRNYKMSQSDYEKILNDQHGLCAICGSPSPGGHGTMFRIDHDHSSGKIRGLLCNKCNVGIGHFDDDTEKMRLAILYLEKSRKS